MHIIQVKNLVKTYTVNRQEYFIIRDISFDVDMGEFMCIVGPSGSGKTTLLYLLSGLETYQSGSIFLQDKRLDQMNDNDRSYLRSKSMGFVFQSYNLVPNLTVYENVMLANVIGKQKKKDEIIKLLTMVGLDEHLSFYPNQLSGGMQQRVAIARALINDPIIIFADEPTGSLDHQTGLLIMELFKKLNKELGITIVMVTHNMDMTQFGSRVIHMLDGKIIKDQSL